MTVETHLVTLGAAAVQFPAPSEGPLVARVLAEPVRTNTHASFVGTSTVTADGSGTGVIKEIAQPPAATVPLDYFEHYDMDGANTVEPVQFWGHGTAGEKLKISYFTR